MATTAERTLQQQRDWYGAPLATVFEDLCAGLAVSQATLARLLGLSPAMVSQLRNGQRAKIANPAAAHRLSQLMDLVQEVGAGRLGRDEALARAEHVRQGTTAFSRGDGDGAATAPAASRGGSAVDEDLAVAALRASAPAAVLRSLGEQVEGDAPALGRLLRLAADA